MEVTSHFGGAAARASAGRVSCVEPAYSTPRARGACAVCSGAASLASLLGRQLKASREGSVEQRDRAAGHVEAHEVKGVVGRSRERTQPSQRRVACVEANLAHLGPRDDVRDVLAREADPVQPLVCGRPALPIRIAHRSFAPDHRLERLGGCLVPLSSGPRLVRACHRTELTR